MAGKRGMKKIAPRKKALILAEVKAGATNGEILKKYAVCKDTVYSIKKRNGVERGEGAKEVQENIWQEMLSLVRENDLVTELINTIKSFIGSDSPYEKNEAMKRILEIIKNAQPPKQEIDVTVKIRGFIAVLVPVILKYVPENLRNSCADEMEAAIG
jgi:hypothetical protein